MQSRAEGSLKSFMKTFVVVAITTLFLNAAPLTAESHSTESAPSPLQQAAISHFENSISQAVGNDSQTVDSPELLGDRLMAERRYEAAINAFKKAPRNSALVWNKIGIAYQLMFDNVDALSCYIKALKIDAGNASVLNNMGTVYVSLKDLKSAEHYYRRALKIDPKSAVVLKNLGTNYLARHKYKEGGKAYSAALAIDPDIFTNNKSPHVDDPASASDRGAMNYYMARVCARAGLTGSAIEYLRRALDERFTNREKIEADVDFAGLRGVPAFNQLLSGQGPQ
jgi:tetratricopeptide (TPR) repeat protein